MKRLVLAAVAVALVAGPALAADSMKMDKAMEATMMCRPATAKEKPMAMMGSKGMICKTMDAKMMGPKMGPNTKGMTTAQADAAWRAWIEQMMQIQSSTGTTGGNG